MSFFSRIFEAIKDAFNLPINPELSEFQKRKLLHEFRLFYGTSISYFHQATTAISTVFFV